MKKTARYLAPVLLGVFALVLVANAQLEPLPGVGNLPQMTFTEMVITIINYILYIVGIIALIFLIYGGITYIISGGNEDQIEKAKKIITFAIVGLIVVIISWVVINAVITEIFWER